MILGFGSMELIDDFDKAIVMDQKPNGTEFKRE